MQFVFGGLSRMNFNNNNTFIELCGYATHAGYDGDGTAIAVYGMHELEADPVGEVLANHAQPGLRHAQQQPKVPRVDYLPVANPCPVGQVGPPCNVETGAFQLAEVAKVNGPGTPTLDTGSWNGPGQAQVDFKLETGVGPLPGSDDDILPVGSVITGVELRVRHSEGNPLGGNQWAKGLPIQTLKLKVTQGQTGDGSNFENAGTITLDVPVCTDFTMLVPAKQAVCDWRFGAFVDQRQSQSVLEPASDERPMPPDTRRVAHDFHEGSTSAARRAQHARSDHGRRDSMERRNAGHGPPPGPPRRHRTPGRFRRRGALRPLRGCLTLRAKDVPTDMIGADHDYAAANSGLDGDDAYTTGANHDDTLSCALVRMFSNSTSGVKLHIQGVVYAPTAAVDLSGKDNEAPFVTDGVIVRHLTAWRWKKGPNLAAIGEQTPSRRDRKVTLSACVGTEEVDRAILDIDDSAGVLYGGRVHISTWLHRPEGTLLCGP